MYLFLSDSGHVVAASTTQKFGYVLADSLIVAALPNAVTQYRYVDETFIHSPRPSLAHVWTEGAWVMSDNLTRLGTARATLATAIKEVRDARKSGGVKVGTDWFHSDDPSRVQHLGLLQLGDNIPADLMWKTMQGTFVVMTKTLVTNIFNSMLAHDMNTFAMAELHIACMSEYYDPYAYNYKSRWPAVYGE